MIKKASKTTSPRHTAQVIDLTSGSIIPAADAAARTFEAAMQDSEFEVVKRTTGFCVRMTSRQDLIEANDSFEAWERLPDTMAAFGEDWHQHGVNVRYAYAAMTSPQSTLVGIWKDLPAAEIDQMLTAICCSSEILKIAAQQMDIVLIRYAAAREAARAVDAAPPVRSGQRS